MTLRHIRTMTYNRSPHTTNDAMKLRAADTPKSFSKMLWVAIIHLMLNTVITRSMYVLRFSVFALFLR